MRDAYQPPFPSVIGSPQVERKWRAMTQSRFLLTIIEIEITTAIWAHTSNHLQMQRYSRISAHRRPGYFVPLDRVFRSSVGGACIRSLAMHKDRCRISAWLLSMMALPHRVWAAGSDMPWEGPLEQIVDSLTGPVAKALGIIAIVALGFGFAFSEGGGALRRVLGVVLGISIAFAAAQFGLSFFGFAGGLSY